jgi:hypothetical protein
VKGHQNRAAGQPAPSSEEAGGPAENKEATVYMFFSFMMALISIAGTVLMIMLIMRGINRAQEIRQQTYLKTLEKGVYDYRLIQGPRSKGMGALGWGIFFASVGLALFISFIGLGIIGEALPGALIPLFIGLGLIVYYVIRKKVSGESEKNGEPVTFRTDAAADGPTMTVVKEDRE